MSGISLEIDLRQIARWANNLTRCAKGVVSRDHCNDIRLP